MFYKDKFVREYAFSIDFLIITIIEGLLFYIMVFYFSDFLNSIREMVMFIPESILGWIIFIFMYLLLFILFMIYYVIFIAKFGASLGLMVFGLKVVDQDKNPISYESAVKSTIYLFISLGIYRYDKKFNLHVVKRSSLIKDNK